MGFDIENMRNLTEEQASVLKAMNNKRCEKKMNKWWICEECPALTINGDVVGTMLRKDRELVQCRDCEHHGNISEDYCRCLEQETNIDFFCGYGKRKDTSVDTNL